MGAQPEWHQVQVLSRVRLVQNMSRKCPTSAFANTLIAPLDILWTRAGFSCPIFVQRPLTWTGSLHQLDSDWTDPVLFLPLDRSWTECRQTLDKSWILCPGSVHPLSNHPLLTRTETCSSVSVTPDLARREAASLLARLFNGMHARCATLISWPL